jgi:two-component system, OmpR family, sensor kinase
VTVKTRITLFIVAAGFIPSLLFSIFVYFELIEQPFNLLDTQLKEEAQQTARLIVKTQKEPDLKLREFYSQETDRYWIEVYDGGTHDIIYRSGMANSFRLPQLVPGSVDVVSPLASQGDVKPGQALNHDEPFRAMAMSIEQDGRTFIVQIARPMEKLNEEIKELLHEIIAGLVISTLVLIAISLFMSGKILRPVSEMKTLAQNISEKNLEQRIPIVGEGRDEFSELARTINRMLDRLQYSFVKQKSLLFDTSHELKTPLTIMRLAVDEITSHEDEGLPALIRNNLSRLKYQVLFMERLVKDLLNLSFLETLSRIDPKPVQISELLSSLSYDYRFIADSHGIKIEVRLPEGLVIQGDEVKLRRAFSNILDNAVKYNVDGGRIELSGDISPAGLTVTVTNTGAGVDKEEIPKVFEQFYRFEKSRSQKYGGSGLGLSIVKRIVELHGGEVHFESKLWDWTRVTVNLPR